MTDHHLSTGGSTECVPNTTTDQELLDVDVVDEDEEDDTDLGDEGELLQRLATRHYYSYTAALGVTVGVGCLLLVLNMLIFAGIYYQRDRDRRRQSSRSSRSNSTPSSENIAMSQRPTPCASLRQSPILSRKKDVPEYPPSYSTLTKSSSDCQQFQQQNSPQSKKPKPPPPVRTSSNPPCSGTVKKRVQIQEISV